MMPELLIDFITSLDGYASAEGEPGTDALAGMTEDVFSTTLTEPFPGRTPRLGLSMGLSRFNGQVS
jgi:hypothetical protein